MATNLYETLGIPTTASPEQIRKAYKKRALQTHPDRLPHGASNQEKTASEEQFRKVNAAYEVLIDPQNRKEYDRHGVWPPPDAPVPPAGAGSQPHSSHYDFRNDFFADPWGHRSFFRFTDPFALFDAIFQDTFPDSHRRPHRHEMPWFSSQMPRMMDDDFDFPRGFGGIMGFPSFGRSLMPPRPPSFFGVGNGGQWQAESFSSSTINGVTQTSHKRRDWDGNEHVTHTYSDGRTVHTINGVEQSSTSRGQIRDREEPQRRHRGTHHGYSTPPPYDGNNPAGQGPAPMITDGPYNRHSDRYDQAHHDSYHRSRHGERR